MADDAGEWLIYIVGSAKMQSELLAVFIEKETGLPCRIEGGSLMFPNELAPGRRSIIFSDCQNRSAKNIVAGMRGFKLRGNPDVYVIFFNVDSTLKVEEELLKLGIWGMFYEEDLPSALPLGVEAIRKGEIWLSRQVMSSCLVNLRRRNDSNFSPDDEGYSLTFREREVLKMLSEGLGNDGIASRLCVSVHTVRSHLYRVFKKIGVSNRNQAAIWVGRNL